MGKLSSRVSSGANHTWLRLTGVIDEDNRLSELSEQIRGELVVIGLGGVRRVNSCGVRDWVNWLADIEREGHRVILVRCSPAVVGQMNMVTNFCGHATVASILAPYYCEQCDLSAEVSIDLVDLPSPPVAPSELCRECGHPLEFDDFEESFFAFVAASVSELDPPTRALIDGLSAQMRDLGSSGEATALSGGAVLTPVGQELQTPVAELASEPDRPVRLAAVEDVPPPSPSRSSLSSPPAATVPAVEQVNPSRGGRSLYVYIAIAAAVAVVLFVLVLLVD